MNSGTAKFLDGLKSNELLLRLTWDEWLGIEAPYNSNSVTTADAWIRYHRNGYDWDMHGTVYTPETERDPRRAVVLFHGGAGSEKFMKNRINRIIAPQNIASVKLGVASRSRSR